MEQTPTALGKMLHRAVRENDRGAALEALDSGADPNWMNPSTSTSALHIACKLGHTKLALLLIQRGADVNCQTKTGWVPMHFAVNTGLVELVELLHSFGGRSDIVNEWMRTPLDIAKERKNEEILEIIKRKPGATTRTHASGSDAGAPPRGGGGGVAFVDAAPVVASSPSSSGLVKGSPRSASLPALQPSQKVSPAAAKQAPVPPSKSPRAAAPPTASSTTTPTNGSSNGATGASSSSPQNSGFSNSAPQVQRISPPTQEAPLPPISKPLPLAPSEGSAGSTDSPVMGKARTGRGLDSKTSMTDLNDPSRIMANDVKRNTNEIARLNKEVASLKNEVEQLKAELARVAVFLQGVDL